MLLDEIEKILLGLGREVAPRSNGRGRPASRHGAPQVVEMMLLMDPARILARALVLRRQRLRPLEPVDTMPAERMAGVEYRLDFRLAVLLLAPHHVAAREHQVIDNRVRLGPLLKQ